jgi:hypothetical protein
VPDSLGPRDPSDDNPLHIDRRLLEGAKTDATRCRQARNWAALIQRVWEVDPLKCIKYGGQMQVVSFIEARQEQVIRRILDHYGLWQRPPRRLPPRPPGAGTHFPDSPPQASNEPMCGAACIAGPGK